MWIYEHEEPTTATREQIWAVWSDIEGWPKWDDGLEWVKPDGPLAVGTRATLKPKGAKVVPFQFVSVTPPDGFVDVTTLPAALMRMEHVLLDKDGELMLRQTVSFTGKLGRVFGWIIGRGMKRDMPGAMRSLLRLAEAS